MLRHVAHLEEERPDREESTRPALSKEHITIELHGVWTPAMWPLLFAAHADGTDTCGPGPLAHGALSSHQPTAG
jgi:hypothetical protein